MHIISLKAMGFYVKRCFDFELNPNKTHFKGHPRLGAGGPSLTGHTQPHQVRIDFFLRRIPKILIFIDLSNVG